MAEWSLTSEEASAVRKVLDNILPATPKQARAQAESPAPSYGAEPRQARAWGTHSAQAQASSPADVPKAMFEGGATRSQQDERYDLIPSVSLRAMARRLALGAERHGDRNWESGGEAFRQATISHLYKHLQDYVENGNRNDANTDAIICNAAFLCFFEERQPLKPASVAGDGQE